MPDNQSNTGLLPDRFDAIREAIDILAGIEQQSEYAHEALQALHEIEKEHQAADEILNEISRRARECWRRADEATTEWDGNEALAEGSALISLARWIRNQRRPKKEAPPVKP